MPGDLWAAIRPALAYFLIYMGYSGFKALGTLFAF